MKKLSLLVVMLVATATMAFSQELTAKNGGLILPEQGDIALGICATPFLSYAGNLLNGTTGNAAPTFNFITGMNNAIYGKYFLTDKMAVRGKLRIGNTSTTYRNYVVDDVKVSSDPDAKVEDKMKMSSSTFVLGAGLEKRRGKSRVQGFYGADLLFMLGSGKTTYEYGNEMTSSNKTPTSTVTWPGPNAGSSVAIRDLEVKSGGTFGLGLRAFVGAEYFFAPKISIGGEFGWGLNMLSTGDGSYTHQTWDNVKNQLKEHTTDYAGNGSFSIDTDNLGGVIYVLFHF